MERFGCTLGLAALVASGCGGIPVVAPPAHVAPPTIDVEPAGPDELPVQPQLSPPELEEVVDELLASSVLRDPEFRAAVDDWIDYWRLTAAPWFPDFLRRMGQFEQTVDSALADRELPASLRYLPFIESGYSPRATSSAEAVGLWQFMEGTALGFGMQVTPLVDERRDPFKSTEAAVRFLSSLHDDFGSWFLGRARGIQR